MKKISLQFKNKQELLEFLRHTGTFRCEIDLEKLTITSQLTEADIELATNGYHARVLEDNCLN